MDEIKKMFAAENSESIKRLKNALAKYVLDHPELCLQDMIMGHIQSSNICTAKQVNDIKFLVERSVNEYKARREEAIEIQNDEFIEELFKKK